MTELWCVSARALNLKKVRSLLKFDITNDRIMVCECTRFKFEKSSFST